MTSQKFKERILTKNKARIFVVDDHPVVRQGLIRLINCEDDLTVCGQAADASEALQEIKKLKPDMAIVDIVLKDTSGIELIKDLKKQRVGVPILTLSMHDETLYAERALKAGAHGYINKAEATSNIIYAIQKILSGQTYLSERMKEKMINRVIGRQDETPGSAIDCLSDRELEVFSYIGQGYGTRQIAEKLFLSVKTIETYREHIKQKLKLSDASEMLQIAILWVNSWSKQ
jgi:DNA-binding NarL/FixJ family response regulator